MMIMEMVVVVVMVVAVVLVSPLVVVLGATSAAAAAATTTTTITTPPSDIEIIDPDIITEQVFDDLRLSRLEDIRLSENGSAVYTFRVMEDMFMTATTNRTVEVYTEHNFTPENGYAINSTGVYTADGTKKVVIPTSEPPIGFEGRSRQQQ